MRERFLLPGSDAARARDRERAMVGRICLEARGLPVHDVTADSLGGELERAAAEGRRRWGLSLGDRDFAADVGALGGKGFPFSASLPTLYLACACLAGDPVALDAVRAEIVAPVAERLRRDGHSEAFVARAAPSSATELIALLRRLPVHDLGGWLIRRAVANWGSNASRVDAADVPAFAGAPAFSPSGRHLLGATADGGGLAIPVTRPGLDGPARRFAPIDGHRLVALGSTGRHLFALTAREGALHAWHASFLLGPGRTRFAPAEVPFALGGVGVASVAEGDVLVPDADGWLHRLSSGRPRASRLDEGPSLAVGFLAGATRWVVERGGRYALAGLGGVEPLPVLLPPRPASCIGRAAVAVSASGRRWTVLASAGARVDLLVPEGAQVLGLSGSASAPMLVARAGAGLVAVTVGGVATITDRPVVHACVGTRGLVAWTGPDGGVNLWRAGRASA